MFVLKESSPELLEKIVTATREIVGLPNKVEPREAEDRFYFVQEEPGLLHTVHQMGASSGTLRMLALMTTLYGDTAMNLVGVEEPENYIHPAALSSFVLHLLDAQDRVQFIITTHSPLLLDFIDDPGVVIVVKRNAKGGTEVAKESNSIGVRKALEEIRLWPWRILRNKGIWSLDEWENVFS